MIYLRQLEGESLVVEIVEHTSIHRARVRVVESGEIREVTKSALYDREGTHELIEALSLALYSEEFREQIERAFSVYRRGPYLHADSPLE